jgi:hypothetical protein
MPSNWIHYDCDRMGKRKTDPRWVPGKGTPCIYFLTRKGQKGPYYIGEYGKAKSYNVLYRIKQHFNLTEKNTLCRMARNLRGFNQDIPKQTMVHIFRLGKKYRNVAKRQSLEAWVIHLVCHEMKIQDIWFAVTKYTAPVSNCEREARRLIQKYQNELKELRGHTVPL